MNIEKMLAECRAHWDKTKPDAVFPDYWLGWKASRESLVIELPQGGYFAGYDNEHMMESRDVRDAIETAGLKVKP